MDDNFPPAGQNVGGEAPDWRSQLPAGVRDSVVNKLMDTLKNHLRLPGEGALQELKNIAVRYEEMYYTSATSQDDYFGKICLKVLTMETESQNLMAGPLQSNAPASQGRQSHMQNQVQQRTIPAVPIHLLPQNSQSNITSTVARLTPNSAGLTSGAASGQNPGVHAVENSMSQGLLSSNSDGQILGGQQQERHHQHLQPYPYNHQPQHLPLKRKLQEGIISQSFSQSQSLLQESQLQSSQHGVPPPSLRQSSALSTLQLNQLSSSLTRQHDSTLNAHEVPIAQHHNILNLQQQASSQHYNIMSMQNVSDFQQQMVEVQQDSSSLQTNKKLMVLQQSKVSEQKQMHQTKQNPLLGQAQQTQQSRQQLITEIQSQPGQLLQNLGLQQSENQLQGEMQRLNQWASFSLQEPTMINQPRQQLQGIPVLPLTSFGSSSQSGNIDGDVWLDEIFQQIISMDEQYFPALSEIYQRTDAELQHE